MSIQSPNTVGGVASGGLDATPGAALAARRARRGWSDWSMQTKGLTVLFVPLLTLVLASIFFYSTSAAENASQNWVTHTMKVRSTIERVTADVLDGETGIRGYMVTGDASFLAPMKAARTAIGLDITGLLTLVSDNPTELARVATLRQLLSRGYQFSLAGVPATSDPVARSAWLHAQKSSTDSIRAVLSKMSATEDALLHQRERTASRARAVAAVAVGVALGAGLLAGLILMLIFTRGITRRLRRLLRDADHLHDGAPMGEADPSADELGVLSRQLREAVATQRALEVEALEARRLAETASDEKSRFLSRMSHELRTPLNAVLGFAQLLEMDANPEQRDPLAQIRRAGRHLLDLINEVLDISRIESGAMTLSAEPVSVAELISEVTQLLAPMATDRHVTILTRDYRECPYYVHADRQRVKQVMLNLVSNAVKYNRPEGFVRFACQMLDDSQIRIDVIDTGIGISDLDLARLFTPFERFSAAESDIEGSGIGLVLSLHLAQAMGGKLLATSRHGEGSTFSIVLPSANEPALATFTPNAPSASPTGDRLRTASLLYIEDNTSNVRLLEQILHRRPNWEMTHAGHGKLGIELAASRPFDLILLDLHLPDISGGEVLGHLRAGGANAHAPVVVISADASPGQIERLIAAGASAYVTKPIDVQELLQLLDEIAASLDRRGV